ncbi:putative RNA-binding Zn ribbon-like protein [Streptosporangium album]|uniref:Putative RNA-binding Zn ribbon-like protein n=1 Tax=Streptosporangium album TaxID=47479 RepID=A0A7W7RUB7_9ACTN|nr:ABATE domain-containing protein [Streptosporangium album]MBB4938282.1 putative RNA-binding Zn ribbon-like protein [Streptosporangium album]
MTAVELVGNALCLDFANTVNARPVARRDWLGTPEEAVTWAAATGHPIEEPDGLAAALPDARELREAVFRVFQPLTQGDRAPQPDLDVVVALHGDGIAHGRLEEADGNFRFSWGAPRTVRILLWEVAASAVELLTHGPLDRLGECPSCCWLFLDVSKNRRRRWCSMTTCGSRDKSRRYYAGRSS